MTIGEFKKALKEYQKQLDLTDDSRILLSSDAEGNSYHEVAEEWGTCPNGLVVYPNHSEVES